jgi:hypothetical protein
MKMDLIFDADCQITRQSRIGFERMNIFKARPHPGLLPLEKEQEKDIPGLRMGFLIKSVVSVICKKMTNNRG